MLEKFGATVSSFLSVYGSSFLVMILAGLLVAIIIELAVKKAFAWLEEKFGDVRWLDVAKMSVIFVVTIALCAVSTHLIMVGELPLPGNKALAPFWFGVIYVAQYVFSMYGIKAILGLKDREPKEKKVKEPKPKKEKKDPLAGLQKLSDNCYTDGAGNYFNKKGKKL